MAIEGQAIVKPQGGVSFTDAGRQAREEHAWHLPETGYWLAATAR